MTKFEEFDDENHEGKPILCWVFTINNYTEKDEILIKSLDGVSKMVVGKEVGESGTPHLQGCIRWVKPQRFSAMKKLFPRAWLAKAKAEDAAYNYCRKEGEMLVDVNNKKQGHRTDIDAAYKAVDDGKTLAEFLREEKPNYQSIQIFKVAASALDATKDRRDIEVHWFYGDSGSGKSHTAHASGAYRILSYKWWDGYEGETSVWFDEVRASFCTFDEWLVLLDVYPLRKESKGSWVNCKYTTVYITSRLRPEEMFPHIKGDEMYQLMRRISTITHFERKDECIRKTLYLRDDSTSITESEIPEVVKQRACFGGLCNVNYTV